jgi:hypothetical protein
MARGTSKTRNPIRIRIRIRIIAEGPDNGQTRPPVAELEKKGAFAGLRF